MAIQTSSGTRPSQWAVLLKTCKNPLRNHYLCQPHGQRNPPKAHFADSTFLFPFPPSSTVLIDTGSHVLLLPQNNCTTCSPTQQKFDPSLSETFSWSPLGAISPGFGTGGDTLPLSTPQGAQCNMATDDVSIQGLTAPGFTFALCWDEGQAMTSQPGIDGILGLGLDTAALQSGGEVDLDPVSLQWALRDAGMLDNGVFGLYTPSGEASAGVLTLGGVDDALFEGELVWLPLDLAGHTTWTMDMQAVFVNGESLVVPSSDITSNASSSTSSPVAVPETTLLTPYPRSLVQALDSGTSFLMAPDNATAAAVYAQVSSQIRQLDAIGTWGCACDVMDELVAADAAQLTFLLGPDEGGPQLNVTVPSRVFNLGPHPGLEGMCQAVLNNWDGAGVHFDGMGLWTLGSPLLKNYYTAWDGLGLRVGWAPLKSTSLDAMTTPTQTAAASPASTVKACSA